MKLSLLTIIILCANNNFAQDKVYWKNGFEYLYEATYLDKNGDTLSAEEVTIKATDTIFNFNQTLLYYSYSLDNINLKSKTDSILGFNKKWVNIQGEGALEGSRLWMHPFRSNQYILTEIAPFPTVPLPPALNIITKGKTKIFSTLGNFKGTVKSTTEITAQETRDYNWGTELNCWKIKNIGKHNKLGTSCLIVYFKENVGILEMNYLFYNGEKMNFKLLQTKK